MDGSGVVAAIGCVGAGGVTCTADIQKPPACSGVGKARWKTLSIGATGPAVRRAQRALISAGVLHQADGCFDQRMQTAVMLFQSHQGLTITGRLDAATAARLKL